MKGEDGNMYKCIPEKLLLDKSVSPTAKTFYLIMCRYIPSLACDINKWAEPCGISEYQAMKALNELIKAGYISKKRSKHCAAGYSKFYYGLYDYSNGCGYFKWIFYLKTNTNTKQATESSSAPSEQKPKAL